MDAPFAIPSAIYGKNGEWQPRVYPYHFCHFKRHSCHGDRIP